MTSRPPAAIAAAIRDSATSWGTVTSMWMRLRCGLGASICWNQNAGPMRAGSTRPVPPGALVDVAEHGLPERPDGLDVERVDGHLAGLGGERLAGQSRRSGQLGDRPRQGDVGVRDGATGGMRRQCHVHAVGVADVEVGVVVGPLGGRCHVEGETGRRVERTGAERRLETAQQVAPVWEAVGGVELARRDSSDHPGTLRRVGEAAVAWIP